MADLDDRGQILVVGGFLLAVVFVALALILNSAIYAENLASRTEATDGDRALQYRSEVRAGTGAAIEHANQYDNTSHATITRNVSNGVADFSDLSARHAAVTGRTTNVSLLGTTNGTRIEQRANRTFTNNSSEGNWTVVEDVSNTRKLRMNVSAIHDDGYQFVANDSIPREWYLNVTGTNASADVEIRDGAGNTYECPSGAASVSVPFWINVSEGTVAGEECAGLVFAENVGDPYEVTIDNGSDLQGNYTMIVDNESLSQSPTDDYNSTGGSPFVEPAMYNVSVELTYESPELFYRDQIRVAPGESDD
ncbi:hypothetical protein BRC83_05240 [Halobacteriales archaeon QS_1_68_17]|nr:MAG: hypothetical protein BRC83_05240 [Halobacteriales archaeon QS_1_68_17]